jgi:hypothetical protein
MSGVGAGAGAPPLAAGIASITKGCMQPHGLLSSTTDPWHSLQVFVLKMCEFVGCESVSASKLVTAG